MLLSHTRPLLAAAESAAANGTTFVGILNILRELSIDEFGELFISMPSAEYPNLSSVLPRMAAEETQKGWTGSAGHGLYPQTTQFVHAIEALYARHCGMTLKAKTILDFGCGYGRFIRMMYYFTDPDHIWGVDAWASSLRICRRSQCTSQLPAIQRASESANSRRRI